MSTYENTYCNTTTDLLFVEPYLAQYDGKRVLPNNFATTGTSNLYQLNNSGALPAAPHASYRYVGHDYGSYDHVVTGFFWYDVDPTYVTGWRLSFASSVNVQAGSWWSCYGLKLPTAD